MGRRHPQAGVTLVEILVVLVLIGVLTGAVALQLRAPATETALREAQLLQARLDRAAGSALTDATRVRLKWETDRYAFEQARAENWLPHPVPLLAETHVLPRGLSLVSQDSASPFVIGADLWPESGAPLVLSVRGGGENVILRFDGVSSRIEAGR